MTAPWWEGPLVGFDTETTGPDPEGARIVTACVVVHDPSHPAQTTRSWDWLVNPGIDIPAGATAVHGITTEQARADGVDPEEAVGAIITALVHFGLPIVAFNGCYDFTVLDREARRHGLEPLVPDLVIDPFVLDKEIDRYRRGKRTLTACCQHYGVELTDAHDAAADAIAAVGLVRAMGRHVPSMAAEELHTAQVGWRAEQSASLEAYFRRTNPSAEVAREWPVLPYREPASVGGGAPCAL